MWHKFKDLLPEEGRLLECTTSSGEVVELVRRGRLLYAGDMYIYYMPVMWRYKNENQVQKR